LQRNLACSEGLKGLEGYWEDREGATMKISAMMIIMPTTERIRGRETKKRDRWYCRMADVWSPFAGILFPVSDWRFKY
jgi:hypothetical protein